jgi:predicted ester cyclase
VQRLTLSGTHAGVFCGVSPTGQYVTWDLVEILRLGPDGKFTEHWSIWDQLGLLRQLSVDPATDEGRA